MKKYSELLKKNAMMIVLVLVYIFFTIMTDGQMFQPLNFNALITQNAYVYILAVGMLMCMLTGGNIDLSCGAFVCFMGAVGGILMVTKGVNTPVSILLMLVVGIIYGVILGYLIAYVNIPPWIATLAGFLAFRGWGTALLSANSTTGSIAPFPDLFLKIFSGKIFSTPITQFNMVCFCVGIVASILVVVLNVRARANKVKKGYEAESVVSLIVKTVLTVAAILLFAYKLAKAGGIPTVLVWVVAIVLIYHFITSKTTLGRYFYTIGGNAEATRLSGVDTKKIMFFAYLNMAVLTVITSYIVIARFQAANSTAGTNYEMDAIAGCVVGGVSAYGGSGTVFGMVVGATLIGVINLGMSLMGVDANWQKVVKGVVLLGAVVFDILANKDKKLS
ncbi:ABC transporter permease subunit [Lacrimispora saccharolytica]|uniref:ABC transporter permease subunit n=1 Tax=Lacrimispora saccharolytica TaxID=84030 RepID=UPI00265C9587|nr:sugar ABC transporter permease [Lacrimispora saccharolytica]MCF2657165.1 sugar ABC transporter permease [Lacrimispora saccharolytica]MCI7557175.1 sugar ABC transporter permease [Lachnospiraceae bacterium]MDD7548061.1 sugar ABC transporter permease [Lachnospiraceae bacterium]MDY4126622.1 sugar ABC transporter permease [Lachnospiraceae bacterium]